MGVFAAQKAMVVSKGYKVLHGFADYNHPLEFEASANDFLYMPRLFPQEKLKQI